MKKAKVLCFLVVMMIGLLAGQSVFANNSVRVGYLALPHYLLTAYVDEAGYGEDLGIDIHAMNFTNGPLMISAIQGGSLDIGLMSCVPVLNTAASNPDSLYVISVFQDTTSVMSLASTVEGIDTIVDLKGKKVVVPIGTGMHFFLELALRKAGLSTNDVTLLHSDPADAMYAMLSGQADATVPFGGYLFSFIEQGGWSFMWGYDLWETEPVVDVRLPDVIVVGKEFADKHPEKVVAFLEAFYRGIDDVYASEDALDWQIGRMNEIIGTEASDVQKTLFSHRPTNVPEEFEDEPSWEIWTAEAQLDLLTSGRANIWFEEAASFFVRENVIQRTPNLDRLVNYSFMNEVVANRTK